MLEEDLTYKIRGAIFAVYKELGPGLLESIYEAALVYELRKRGLCVEQQKELKVYYDGVILPIDYKIDLLVEDKASRSSVNEALANEFFAASGMFNTAAIDAGTLSLITTIAL